MNRFSIRYRLALGSLVVFTAWSGQPAVSAAQVSQEQAATALISFARVVLAFVPKGVKGIVSPHAPEGMQRFLDIVGEASTARMFQPGKSRYGWNWLAAQYDKNHDGRVTRQEFSASPELFDRLDCNRDGMLTLTDFDWSDRSPLVLRATLAGQFLGWMDGDGNGRISSEEWTSFYAKTAKVRAYLTQQDLMEILASSRSMRSPGKTTGSTSESISVRQTQRFICLCRGESLHLWREAPHLDRKAPDFALKTVDEKEEVRLSQFRGRRPVVLVFGSCTCPPWRQQVAVMEDLHQRYRDRVEFLMVYLREAHPIDGWRTEANDRIGLTFVQPTVMSERRKIAAKFRNGMKIQMKMVIDEMDDRVAIDYNARPSRYFVIDRDGRVAYRAEGGPYGLNPSALEQALLLLLAADAHATGSATSPASHGHLP